MCFQRRHLSRLIGLDRFKGKRIEWLKKDFYEFFEFQELCVSGPADSLASLFVSRTPLTKMPSGDMPDEQRIASIPEGGPRLGIFQLWQKPNIIYWKRLEDNFAALIPLLTDRGANYDERLLSAYTSLIFTGQMSLRSLTNALPKPEDDE